MRLDGGRVNLGLHVRLGPKSHQGLRVTQRVLDDHRVGLLDTSAAIILLLPLRRNMLARHLNAASILPLCSCARNHRQVVLLAASSLHARSLLLRFRRTHRFLFDANVVTLRHYAVDNGLALRHEVCARRHYIRMVMLSKHLRCNLLWYGKWLLLKRRSLSGTVLSEVVDSGEKASMLL